MSVDPTNLDKIKTCVSCQFFNPTNGNQYCMREVTTKINLVDGSRLLVGALECNRERMSGAFLSALSSRCGQDGKYWKPKVK